MAEAPTQRRPYTKGDAVRDRAATQAKARAAGEFGELIRAGRVDVHVRLGPAAAWEWPAHALVVPVGPDSDPGGFAQVVLRELNDRASALADAISERRAVAPSRPQLLSRSFGVENHFILATAREGDGPPTVENAGLAARAVAELAAERNYAWVVMPLIGSGASGLSSRETALAMLRGLQEAETKGRKIAVTLFTMSPDAHQALLDRRASRPQRLFNDLSRGRDLLDVESEAHALMSTLLLADVQPPIVAGILGGWGEGKSFIMHLMKERMREIRAMPVGDQQREFPWIGHSYAIEFDAWTFAKSDLWASLLQQIFAQLGEQLSVEKWLDAQKIPDEIAAQLIEPLAQLRPSARAAVLRTALDAETAKQLGDVPQEPAALWNHIEAQQRDRRLALEDERIKLAEETKALHRQAEAVVALQRLVGDLGIELPAMTARLWNREVSDSLLEKFRDWRAILRDRWQGIVLVTIAVVAGLWMLGDIMQLPKLAETWSMGLAAAVTFVGNLWVRANQSFTELRRKVETLTTEDREEVERVYATLLSRSPEFGAKQAKLDALEAEIAHLDSNSRLARFLSISEFVDDRIATAEYEQRLGSLHRVQLDLRQLTECLVVHEGDPHAEAKRKLFPRGPARVVLFIDDLDRCPPTRVVEVLEAVQLLVKTELFVVVVAMDERYVTRALEKQYEGILSQHIRPTGLDYIEKIIQLPYRVRQVNETALKRYLAEQMDIRVELERDETTDDGQSTEDQPPDTKSPPRRDSAGGEANAPIVDLPSRVLMFDTDQYELLARCCTELKLSPRSSKRLVNVYKLLKILWFEERPHREPSKDVEPIVIALVSLSAFYAAGARRLLRVLQEAQRDPAATFASVLASLRTQAAPNPQRVRDWNRTLAAAEELLPGTLEVKALPELTLDLVVSFSFVGDLDEVDA